MRRGGRNGGNTFTWKGLSRGSRSGSLRWSFLYRLLGGFAVLSNQNYTCQAYGRQKCQRYNSSLTVFSHMKNNWALSNIKEVGKFLEHKDFSTTDRLRNCHRCQAKAVRNRYCRTPALVAICFGENRFHCVIGFSSGYVLISSCILLSRSLPRLACSCSLSLSA